MKLSTQNRSEVDIRVAQELKNNQDFIYQTNQSLQNLSFSMTAFEKLLNELSNLQTSHNKQIDLRFEKIYDELISFSKDIKKQISVLSQEQYDFIRDSEDKLSFIDYLVRNADAINLWIKNQEGVNEKIHANLRDLHHGFASHRNLIDGKLEETARVIQEQFPDHSNVFNMLWKAMNDLKDQWTIEKNGMTEEIRRLQKLVEYGEKKFEAVFTRLDRLGGKL